MFYCVKKNLFSHNTNPVSISTGTAPTDALCCSAEQSALESFNICFCHQFTFQHYHHSKVYCSRIKMKWHHSCARYAATQRPKGQAHQGRWLCPAARRRACLQPHHGYQQVKSYRIPSEKVTELLDNIIQKGPEAALGLTGLQKDQALREAFPVLHFIKDLPVNAASSGRTKSALSYIWNIWINFWCTNKKETPSRRPAALDLQGSGSAQKICNSGGWCCRQSDSIWARGSSIY